VEQKRLYLDGEILWTGIRKAASRSEEPILCLVEEDSIRFVALSGLRLVVSWEIQLRSPGSSRWAFVVPPVIADWLSCEAVRSQAGVEVVAQGNDVSLRLADQRGDYEIRWRSDLASFPAPDEFSELVKVPEALMEVPYLKISDAAHKAVAKLVHMELEKQVDRTRLAILIALDFGGFSVDGREIIGARLSQHYFDPRLVIRALEFIRERTIRVGITPLKDEQRACLSLLARQEDWEVHCSLLSIGLETQKRYPLPSGRNR
jgi:hypothetical protein